MVESTGRGRPAGFLSSEDLPVLVEVRVSELSLDSDNKIGLVVLKEADGDRRLRIYIGEAEVLAIAYHLESVPVARPLTHDLLCSVLRALGGNLQKVVITKVEERTYYAELLVRRNGDIIGLDARPSDSIALALRAAAGIFVDEELLNAATLEYSQDKAAAEMTFGEATFDIVQDTSAEDLEERLRRLNPEDFGRFKP